MGQSPSYSPNYYQDCLWFYNQALEKSCIPDVGIDESLLKYSGSDSNAVLQAFNKEMLNTVPGYVSRVGSAIGGLTSVPNAVGLGALVLSLIIELIIKSNTQASVDTYSLIRRVFGEEKASRVRDTMSLYLGRHRAHMGDSQQLREEIRRLEYQLSDHLTVLSNSLLQDGQMSSRGFKIWVNGAAFHVQMRLHEARLNIQTGKPAPNDLNSIKATINLYLQDLDKMLEEYKSYKINSNMFRYTVGFAAGMSYVPNHCFMIDNEMKKCGVQKEYNWDCSDPKMAETYMDIVYSNNEQIKGLKSYFISIKDNLNSLIHQQGSLTLSSAAG